MSIVPQLMDALREVCHLWERAGLSESEYFEVQSGSRLYGISLKVWRK